jgi:hypothetical protein
VSVDGKKATSKKPKTVSMSKRTQEEAEEEVSSSSSSEASEDETDPDYEESVASDVSQSDGGSDAETDVSENEDNAEDSSLTAAAAMKKTKAKMIKKPKQTKKTLSTRSKASKRKSDGDVKSSKKRKTEGKAEEKVQAVEKKEEKTFSPDADADATAAGEDASTASKTGKASTKKEMATFSDKNVDYDLFHNSATNVIPRRIKISNNLVITCRMVEQFESKNITNDYPAITFQRKTAGEKCFEFILPLNLSPKIVEAVNLIINDNAKFFKSA